MSHPTCRVCHQYIEKSNRKKWKSWCLACVGDLKREHKDIENDLESKMRLTTSDLQTEIRSKDCALKITRMETRNISTALEITQMKHKIASAGTKELFMYGDFSDIELEADGKVFKAHRAILASRSPVFKSMFSSSLREGREKRLIIRDMSPPSLQAFLHLLYSGELPEDFPYSDLGLSILAASEKYQIPEMKEAIDLHMAQKFIHTPQEFSDEEFKENADLYGARRMVKAVESLNLGMSRLSAG